MPNAPRTACLVPQPMASRRRRRRRLCLLPPLGLLASSLPRPLASAAGVRGKCLLQQVTASGAGQQPGQCWQGSRLGGVSRLAWAVHCVQPCGAQHPPEITLTAAALPRVQPCPALPLFDPSCEEEVDAARQQVLAEAAAPKPNQILLPAVDMLSVLGPGAGGCLRGWAGRGGGARDSSRVPAPLLCGTRARARVALQASGRLPCSAQPRKHPPHQPSPLLAASPRLQSARSSAYPPLHPSHMRAPCR